MKSTFTKKRLLPLLSALLLFVAFLFSTTTASAQVVDVDQKLNWMLEGQALVALENEINLWANGQQQGAHGTPGSPAWVNADNHIHYYKAIMQAIQSGAKVYVAVGEGVLRLNDGASAANELVPPAVLTALKADATDLLTL